jgi:hypothetical protein
MGSYYRSKSSGCLTFFGFASIIVGGIYLLFSDPSAFFDGVVNILTFILLFFLIIGAGIFLPLINFNKKETEINSNSEKIRYNDEHTEIIIKEKEKINKQISFTKEQEIKVNNNNQFIRGSSNHWSLFFKYACYCIYLGLVLTLVILIIELIN